MYFNPLYRALGVIARTDHIRQYLTEHDPKALEQVERAMEAPAKGLQVTIVVRGEDLADVETGIREALRRIVDGNTGGQDKNETGSLQFDVDGVSERVLHDAVYSAARELSEQHMRRVSGKDANA
jgi:ethanolamine utilization microcompartment shell protein EutL